MHWNIFLSNVFKIIVKKLKCGKNVNIKAITNSCSYVKAPKEHIRPCLHCLVFSFLCYVLYIVVCNWSFVFWSTFVLLVWHCQFVIDKVKCPLGTSRPSFICNSWFGDLFLLCKFSLQILVLYNAQDNSQHKSVKI